jgi:hypothetical protein
MGGGGLERSGLGTPWPLLLFERGTNHAFRCRRHRRHLLRCVGRLFSSPANCSRIRTAAAIDSALQIAGEREVAAIELGC